MVCELKITKAVQLVEAASGAGSCTQGSASVHMSLGHQCVLLKSFLLCLGLNLGIQTNVEKMCILKDLCESENSVSVRLHM